MLFLTATKLDVRFDLFTQPIAIPWLRQETAQILNAKYPLILIRIDYAELAKRTPMRPEEDSWSLDSSSFAHDSCLICYALSGDIMEPK